MPKVLLGPFRLTEQKLWTEIPGKRVRRGAGRGLMGGRDNLARVRGMVVCQGDLAQVDFVAYVVLEFGLAYQKSSPQAHREANVVVFKIIEPRETNGEVLYWAEIELGSGIASQIPIGGWGGRP